MTALPASLIDALESRRRALQADLDAAKSQSERNRLGQFATPAPLAAEILSYARALWPAGTPVRFLDPAFGTGSFYSALLRAFESEAIAAADGYEIDPHYGQGAAALWGDAKLRLRLADFTRAAPPAADGDRANLLICNPPYVRHHHLAPEEKRRLRELVERAAGVRLGGLSGLYCYFLCLSHVWLSPGGLAGWLIPTEFMDVNYGQQVQEDRPPAPLLCTYMGRADIQDGRAFRFIVNYSRATAANVYLMLYPRPALQAALRDDPSLSRAIWQALQQLPPGALLGEGRVYGGGLHKLEPSELGNAPADVVLAAAPALACRPARQLALFSAP